MSVPPQHRTLDNVKVWPEGPTYEAFQRAFPALADPWPRDMRERPVPKFVPFESVDLVAVIRAGFDIELTQHLSPDTRLEPSSYWLLMRVSVAPHGFKTG